MKNILALSFLLAGCEMSGDTKARWSATGKLLASDVAKIAMNTFIEQGLSRFNGASKSDWLDSAAQGLRENAITRATPVNVAKYIEVWTAHQPEADDLAKALAKLLITVPYAERPKAVEVIAQGLNLAAESERQP